MVPRYASGPAEATMSTGLDTLAAAGRNCLTSALRSCGKFRYDQSFSLAGIRAQNAWSTRIRKIPTAVPESEADCRELRRYRELVQCLRANDSGLVKQRIHGHVVGRQSCGM